MSLTANQLAGALHLANRKSAYLADVPGYGKTAQAITACDLVLAKTVLVVTTASARANWLAEFKKWSDMPRQAAAVFTTNELIPDTDIVVVAWSNIISARILQQLTRREWDVMVLDEAHYAKNPTAQRTLAVFGPLRHRCHHIWCLSGTPIPNAPNDLYPVLKALHPPALMDEEEKRPFTYDAFMHRFCVVKRRFVNGRSLDVPIAGKKMDELHERLRGFMLRREKLDLPPVTYSTLALSAPGLSRLQINDADLKAILDAAETGTTRDLEMHLGPLRRLTGELKAAACAEYVAEELRNGLDKIVLFHWHTDVGASLRTALREFGVVGIDGSTPGAKRQAAVTAFQNDPKVRVFVGQIQAAGEAITLTAANQCLFVESSFVPKDMIQAARRIARRGQTRPCICRVAALAGSIDEALQAVVTRKVAAIREIIKEDELAD